MDALSITSKIPTLFTPTEARIERDPTTGAILRVIHPPSTSGNPLNDPLNDSSANESDDERDGGLHYEPRGIIRELEEQSMMEAKKRPRQQSKREEEWIAKLVQRYGDNFGGMVKDRKLNPYQQSEGDLRRRVSRWKERGRE